MLHPEKALAKCGHRAGQPLVLKSSGLKNFHEVTPWLYRGGQPDEGGARFLKELGIRTVVCLRWSPWLVNQERRFIVEAGMEFVSMPLNYWTYPSEKEVREFFEILDESAHHPVFVHCKHGADRTGLMVAFYRMVKEGWSVDEAYHEMKSLGFHRIKMHHFKWALYRFAARLDKAQSGMLSNDTAPAEMPVGEI